MIKTAFDSLAVTKRMVLGYIIEKDEILLGFKKIGFGVGRYNGIGGKVEGEESWGEALDREFEEEVGLRVYYATLQGVIRFVFEGSNEILEVAIARVFEYRGEIKESDEIRPGWFKLNRLPYDEMWVDDRYWLPFFILGKMFVGNVYFKDESKIIDFDFKTVKDMSGFSWGAGVNDNIFKKIF